MSAFIGDFFELGDFGVGEQEATCGFAGLGGLVFELAGQEAVFIAVADDVFDDGLDVAGLVAACGKGAGA